MRTRADRIALGVLATFAVLTLASPLARLLYLTELPNEGWNAVHALNAFSRALFPGEGVWIINNYPPLWPYLIGALAWATGDPILPARIVALVAFLATAAGIGLLLRRLGAGIAAALFGALCFIAIIAGLLDLYVGLADPQMLAHALVTLSVAGLIGSTTKRGTALAALGVVLGMFVKPIVIALPLAATLWLAIHRRHLLAAWIATGTVASLAAFGACVAGYGMPFISNFTFPRVLTWNRLGTNLALISKAAVPLVVFALVAARRGAWRHPALAFAALAIAAAMAEIVLFGAALGVSINIVFDLVIAAAIAAGLAFDRIEAAFWRAAFVAALIVRIAVGMANPLRDVTPRGQAELRAQKEAIRAVIARVAPLPGEVACEPIAACAWAGKAASADLWKLRFEQTLEPLDKPGFLAAVRAGRFDAVVTYASLASPADDRNLPGFFDALQTAYDKPVAAGPAFLIFARKLK